MSHMSVQRAVSPEGDDEMDILLVTIVTSTGAKISSSLNKQASLSCVLVFTLHLSLLYVETGNYSFMGLFLNTKYMLFSPVF